MIEQFRSISLIHFHSSSEHICIEIIRSLLNDRTPLDSLDHHVDILDLENDDLGDLHVLFKQIGLAERSGDPVEEQELLGRKIAVCGDESMDVMVPDFDRDLVGDEESFSGVFVVDHAGRGLGGEASEDVP